MIPMYLYEVRWFQRRPTTSEDSWNAQRCVITRCPIDDRDYIGTGSLREAQVGWILGLPKVGRPIMGELDNGHLMLTSPVERVLFLEETTVYAQTCNAVYCLALVGDEDALSIPPTSLSCARSHTLERHLPG